MPEERIIVFVCEHGAAKSIIAATYFNQLAKENGLNVKAVARGTHPESDFSKQAVKGLAKDGLFPIAPAPQKLTTEDIRSAEQILSFCELPAGYHATSVEQWIDVPPVSEDYDTARDAILEHLHNLLNRIRSSK